MSDRDELTSVVAYALGWEWDEAPGVPSVAETLADVIDDIEEWLAARDARVAAEALEAAARIADAKAAELHTNSTAMDDDYSVFAEDIADSIRARAAEYRTTRDDEERGEG